MPESVAVDKQPDLVSPKVDVDFFAIGRVLLQRSTCLKTQTAALIVVDKEIISWGVNMCCPQNQVYGLPVIECPRMNKETGTYYELCKPIHAEIVAAINAFGISHIDRKTLWHFPGFTIKLHNYAGFFKSKNAKLYLLGHYWACQECIDFLKMIGITEIKFDDLSGGNTLHEYRTKDLTGKDHAVDVSGCIVTGVVTVTLEPEELQNFCLRQGVKSEEVHVLPNAIENGNLYLVSVPVGNEALKANSFEKDPAIREARVLFLKTA